MPGPERAASTPCAETFRGLRLLIALALLPALAGADVAPAPPATAQAAIAEPALCECSGLVASRRHPGVFWAHNDSGNEPELFAIDREGRTIARFAVAAPNDDWEDIAIDARGIYLADIGDNAGAREEVVVHRIDEPDPWTPAGAPLPVRAHWRLLPPADGPHDSEALVVAGDHGFLLRKAADGARILRFRLDVDGPQPLVEAGLLPVPYATGADLAPDGRQLAVSSPFGLHVFRLAEPFPHALDRARQAWWTFADPHCESVCFAGGAVITASEDREMRWFPPARLGEAVPGAVATVHRAPPEARVDGDAGEWGAAWTLPLRGADAPPRLAAGWEPGLLRLAIAVPALPAWIDLQVGPMADGRAPEYGPEDHRMRLAIGPTGAATLESPRPLPSGTVHAVARAGAGAVAEIAVPLPERPGLACVITSLPDRSRWWMPADDAAGTWASPLAWAALTLED